LLRIVESGKFALFQNVNQLAGLLFVKLSRLVIIVARMDMYLSRSTPTKVVEQHSQILAYLGMAVRESRVKIMDSSMVTFVLHGPRL
jgi:hypothetical protein